MVIYVQFGFNHNKKNKQTNKQTKEKKEKKRKKEKKEKKERKKDVMLEFVISEKKPSVNVDYVKLCHAVVAILDFLCTTQNIFYVDIH